MISGTSTPISMIGKSVQRLTVPEILAIVGGRRAGRGPLLLENDDDDDDDEAGAGQRQQAPAAATGRVAGRRRAPGFFSNSTSQAPGGSTQRAGRFGSLK